MCELQDFLCSAHRRMHSGMCDVRCTKNLQLTFEMNGVRCTFFPAAHIAHRRLGCEMCAARKIMQLTLQFFKVRVRSMWDVRCALHGKSCSSHWRVLIKKD